MKVGGHSCTTGTVVLDVPWMCEWQRVSWYLARWKVRKSLLLMEWRILRFQVYGQTTKRERHLALGSSPPLVLARLSFLEYCHSSHVMASL